MAESIALFFIAKLLGILFRSKLCEIVLEFDLYDPIAGKLFYNCQEYAFLTVYDGNDVGFESDTANGENI